jgi:hypothetical protein
MSASSNLPKPPNKTPFIGEDADSINSLRERICKNCAYLVNNICVVPHTNYCKTAEKIDKLLEEEYRASK